MSIVVEDGTGLVDAAAYDSLNDGTNYHMGRADYHAWISMSEA